MPDAVASLARDLAGPPAFQHLALDVASPGLVAMMEVDRRQPDTAARAVSLAPPGPPFFVPHGWQPIEVRSIIKAAGKIGRLPFAMRMFSLLPESEGAQGFRPWSAVCLFARNDVA